MISIDRSSGGESAANNASAGKFLLIASAVIAWTAIIFVCPIALVALYMLVPNIVELIDRVLHHPVMPRRPLTLMLIAQMALVALPAMTFVSWRRGRKELKTRHRAVKTIALGGATLGLSLLAYLWIAVMVASFPD